MVISKKQIKIVTDCIVKIYKPDKIILFGSYAMETQNAKSDLDIMVISDREKDVPRYKRDLQVRLAIPDINIPKDILFYTSEEIEKWKDVKLSFVRSVLDDGKVVYEK